MGGESSGQDFGGFLAILEEHNFNLETTAERAMS
jgi:hypothetical protein